MRDQMRSVAKPVNAQTASLPGFAITAITNETGAKERRCLHIAVSIRQVKAKPCVGGCILGVTAIDGVTGETRVVAEIFPMRSAVRALAIGPAQPGNAHAIANLKFWIRLLADLLNTPYDLVAGDQRQLRFGQLAINHVKICATHGAGRNPHQ